MSASGRLILTTLIGFNFISFYLHACLSITIGTEFLYILLVHSIILNAFTFVWFLFFSILSNKFLFSYSTMRKYAREKIDAFMLRIHFQDIIIMCHWNILKFKHIFMCQSEERGQNVWQYRKTQIQNIKKYKILSLAADKSALNARGMRVVQWKPPRSFCHLELTNCVCVYG